MHKLLLFVLIAFGSLGVVACDWAFLDHEDEKILEVAEDEIDELIERHKRLQEARNQPKVCNMKIVPLKD
jgi:hypothetical protein